MRPLMWLQRHGRFDVYEGEAPAVNGISEGHGHVPRCASRLCWECHGACSMHRGQSMLVGHLCVHSVKAGLANTTSTCLCRESQDLDTRDSAAVPGEPEKAAAKRRGRFHVVDEKDVDGRAAAAGGLRGGAELAHCVRMMCRAAAPWQLA